MDSKEYLGKTSEDAIQKALAELGITRDEADILVLDEGSKGILSLFGKMARVLVSPKMKLEDIDTEPLAPTPSAREASSPRPVRASAPVKTREEPKGVPAAALADGSVEKGVAEFLSELARLMNVADPVFDVEQDDQGVKIHMNGRQINALIGHHGDTLNALQTLAGLVANQHHEKANEDFSRVWIDIGDYRKKREETLASLAHRLASKARQSRRPVSLEPMNSFERRIIHAALADEPGITTISKGDEPNRHVVITYR